MTGWNVYGYVNWYSDEDERDIKSSIKNILTVFVQVVEEGQNHYICCPLGGFGIRRFPKNQVSLIHNDKQKQVFQYPLRLK